MLDFAIHSYLANESSTQKLLCTRHMTCAARQHLPPGLRTEKKQLRTDKIPRTLKNRAKDRKEINKGRKEIAKGRNEMNQKLREEEITRTEKK